MYAALPADGDGAAAADAGHQAEAAAGLCAADCRPAAVAVAGTVRMAAPSQEWELRAQKTGVL